MIKNIFTVLILLGFSSFGFAQDSQWSLERCINHAQQNNLSIQQSGLSVQQAELTLKGNKREYHPNLSGSVSYGLNSGRSIDPTTNDFVQSTIQTNGVSLNSGAIIYSGGRIPSTIQQSKYNLQASKLDVDNLKNNIGLQVARAYLQILLAEEQLENSKVNLKQLEDQLAQTNKLIKAGTLPENNRLDIDAQIATSEQTLVGNQNSVDIAYLNIKQLLQLEPNTPFVLEKPVIELPTGDQLNAVALEGVYDIALQNQPNIAAGELRTKSAEKGVDIAKSALLPTLSVGGGLNTNYSSIGRDITNPDITITEETTFYQGFVDGQASEIGLTTERPEFTFPNANYFQQFGGNLSVFLGLTLNVPIYNRGLTKISIEQSQLGVLNQQFNNRILRQTLKTDIQRAIADAKAAYKQMQAAEKSVKAQEASAQNTERRFKAGSANSFEYNTTRNNVESAKSLYIIAKYDYLFKLKIIDFYQGKPIQLK